MKDRLINIGHIIVATISFGIIVSVLEHFNPFAIPMPLHLEISTPEFAEYMANQPVSAYLWIILGYAVGSFGAGFVLSRLSNNLSSARIALAGGLTGLGIMNMFALPQPTWFWISVLVYFPFIFLGAKIYPKRTLEEIK